MPWSAILAVLLQTILPLLVEWLQKWLESRMKVAAERLPAVSSYPSNERAVAALFDEVIASVPRRAMGRRLLLKMLKNKAVARADEVVAGTFELDADEIDEMRDVGAIAESE